MSSLSDKDADELLDEVLACELKSRSGKTAIDDSKRWMSGLPDGRLSLQDTDEKRKARPTKCLL